MYKWYRLDNAAKVFPSVTGERNSSVFRFAAILKEKIDPELLQQAVDIVMPRYPMFSVRLRRGIFWNYLDENKQPLKVQKEHTPPSKQMDTHGDGGYMLRVIYYEHRLSLEMFHALTDGSGAIEFFKSLLYYYFQLTGESFPAEGKVKLVEEAAIQEEVDDSFSKHYTPLYSESTRSLRSFHIRGVPYDNGDNSLIHGVMDSRQLNQIAKSYGGSITSYLAALMIYSIYQTRNNERDAKRPIVIAIPVNLRPSFPSKTLRNFFNVINVGAYMTDEMTLAELVQMMQEMLIQKTTKTYLQSSINNNVNFERNVASKFVPLFVKHYFVRLGFDHLSESKKTITLTNLGRVDFPTPMYDLIEHMEISAYPTQKSPMACGLISCNDRLTISFIKNIVEADVIQFFFSHLATVEKLDVNVYSNELNLTFET